MRSSSFHTFFSNAAPRISSGKSMSRLLPSKYARSHARVRLIVFDSRSSISCAGNHFASRRSRRTTRPPVLLELRRCELTGPTNSSAHSPSSDDNASMSPSGVETIARDSFMWLQQSLDQVADDALLLFD